MKRFLRDNWIEILGIIGIILGILIVIERYTIRFWMTENLGDLQTFFAEGFQYIYEQARAFAMRVSPSTWVGILIALACFLLVGLRLRYRFLNSYRWNDLSCPRCGSELERIHRSLFQRFLSRTFLPEGRLYQCVNEECGWKGMKRAEGGHRRRRRTEASLD